MQEISAHTCAMISYRGTALPTISVVSQIFYELNTMMSYPYAYTHK